MEPLAEGDHILFLQAPTSEIDERYYCPSSFAAEHDATERHPGIRFVVGTLQPTGNHHYSSDSEALSPPPSNPEQDGSRLRPHNRRRRRVHLRGSSPSKPVSHKPTHRHAYTESFSPTSTAERKLHSAFRSSFWFTMQYVFDVCKLAMRLLRPPLALLVFFTALPFIFEQTFLAAVSPLCVIPGISTSNLCLQTLQTGGPSPNTFKSGLAINKERFMWADFSKLMEIQSKTFGQLLGESTGGPALSLELQSAQMATKDLTTSVKHSSLPAKEILTAILADISTDAKLAADHLGKLTAKVGGSVDNIIAANDWALLRIEEARTSTLSPWSIHSVIPWIGPKHTLNTVVSAAFEDAMNVLSKQMERLLIEAGHNLQNLYNLEERLSTLLEVIHRENVSQLSSRDELLAEIWTVIGGNRVKVDTFDRNLVLLKDLATYRKAAVAHVLSTVVALRGMRDEIEDIKERVAAPDLLGGVPAEVHIKSIRLGLDRLRIGRVNSRKQAKDVFSGNSIPSTFNSRNNRIS